MFETGRRGMSFRIVHTVLAASLLGCLAAPVRAEDPPVLTEIPLDVARLQSATAYDAGVTADGRPASALLPDERDRPVRPLALIVPAALIIALTGLGLAITFRALRHDIRTRRIVYRQRGRQFRDRTA
jgi:hypothetical protein